MSCSISVDLAADMAREAREKVVLHWNYRGLSEIPEAVRTAAGPRLREIYLKRNELEDLPGWLAELEGLGSLYLHGNRIDRLPGSFGRARDLAVLDLSANRLRELPDCLGCLPNLRSLMLSQNDIDRLPASMKRLEKLESLYLSRNRMAALPEWLGSLPNLDHLYADNNLLTEIPNRLTLSTSLSMISVCSNRLSHLPLNGFLSSPQIRFDSNPDLNYLSLPVLYQLASKLRQPLNQESGNTLAYGCFKPDSKTTNCDVNIKLSLVPENNHGEYKQIVIQLPRQLIVVHSLRKNRTISLWELSLRKVYLSSFHHTIDISLDPLNVNVKRKQYLNQPAFDMSEFSKSFLPFNLILNGPVSICMSNYCNEPIFTEAWIIFGIGRNAFLIPSIVIFCSHRCAAEFVNSSNFIENHEMYVIKN